MKPPTILVAIGAPPRSIGAPTAEQPSGVEWRAVSPVVMKMRLAAVPIGGGRMGESSAL